MPAHDLAHGAFDPFLLGRVEMTEKRGVIFVRECRKLRQQRPPLRGDCQGLIAPILDAGPARHERLGFKKVAHFEQVGYKQDRWVDVGYWQLLLEA